jgi:DNA-directed RNA polymerase specialized sigma24 family protein
MRQAADNADFSDSELVTLSLAGDRDAFGRIVTRYQTLLCSLAYSATGRFSQSEDLAQETHAIHAVRHTQAAYRRNGEPSSNRPGSSAGPSFDYFI